MNYKCIAGFDPKPTEVHGEECFLKQDVNEREEEGKTVENFRKRAKENIRIK